MKGRITGSTEIAPSDYSWRITILSVSLQIHRIAHHILCLIQSRLLTLSDMGVVGPTIALGGQFDPHFLTAPWGLLDHNSSNFNHNTV